MGQRHVGTKIKDWLKITLKTTITTDFSTTILLGNTHSTARPERQHPSHFALICFQIHHIIPPSLKHSSFSQQRQQQEHQALPAVPRLMNSHFNENFMSRCLPNTPLTTTPCIISLTASTQMGEGCVGYRCEPVPRHNGNGVHMEELGSLPAQSSSN